MNNWLKELNSQLLKLKNNNLLRSLRPAQPHGKHICINNQKLINLASNDYLALANHQHLKNAAINAIQNYGTGASASRLITGNQQIHEDTEQRFAAFKKAPAALLTPTGFTANLAVITTLTQKGDLICLDKLSHASLIDAASASKATLRTYPHLKLEKLKRLLEKHQQQSLSSPSTPKPRRFIVSDSVFSMDGDTADLPALCDLAEKYNAITIIDEAHATGVLGQNAAGLAELQNVSKRVDITISTASKALAGLGGIITAQKPVIDTIINNARSFIYTTAIPPAQAAAINAALDILRDEPNRRLHLLTLANNFRKQLTQNLPKQFSIPHTNITTPIIPIITQTPESALNLSKHLQEAGFYAPAIRPPTVPPNSSRVRITLRADLDENDITNLINAIRRHSPGRTNL